MPVRIWYFRRFLLHTYMAQTLLGLSLGPKINTHDEIWMKAFANLSWKKTAMPFKASLVAQRLKCLPAMRET